MILAHIEAKPVHLERGLPQGAPESPLLFVLVMEMVLRPLLENWRLRGSGWRMDSFWLTLVAYADDILLVSSSKKDLEHMVSELLGSLEEVGLTAGLDKTRWTSYPALPAAKLKVGDAKVDWVSCLTFVGARVSLNAGSGDGLEYRKAQANKVFHKWRAVLLLQGSSAKKRAGLAASVMFSTALWVGEVWTPTRQQRRKLNSWGA